MTRSAPLRIGLVGGGHWARTVHAPALVAHPGVEFAAVWTRRPEAAAGLGAPLAGSFAELVDAVDAVAFAVPPQVQAGLAIEAASAGRHLICEKPLAADVAGARKVVDAVAAAGVVSSVVLTLRHDAGVQEWLAGFGHQPASPDTVGLARWLSGALLGGPYATSGWRAEPGNGAVLDLGPHVVDLLESALGPVVDIEWARYDEPDLWRFGLRHAGGARSTTVLSLRLPVDPSEIEIAAYGGAGTHVFRGRVADAQECYKALLDEFLAAVHGTGPMPVADAARGLRLQEIVDGVRALAR
ncbi:Gfo/Idh/MocA family protein [Pseudonocardia sp. CA-107938]|uniref:Gfo/Idh/MocA family protein n=1 Tax=Pseudonocardia sp. CA-107938 TaxID=3240021 RepID=UPI003D89D1D1